MRAGIPIIVQGALADGRWGGRPDILRRVAAHVMQRRRVAPLSSGQRWPEAPSWVMRRGVKARRDPVALQRAPSPPRLGFPVA
jgi:hypothetical protein